MQRDREHASTAAAGNAVRASAVDRIEVLRRKAHRWRRSQGLIPYRATPLTNPDGTLRGWRAWLTDTQKEPCDVLLSIGTPHRWPRGALVATCHKGGEHRPPLPTCSCGIHAFNAPWLLVEALRECELPNGLIVGEVAASGTISVHQAGWRAERTSINALWHRDLRSDQAAQLGAAYDVDVTTIAEAPSSLAVLMEYGG